jgi:putative phosphoribosyl transferase
MVILSIKNSTSYIYIKGDLIIPNSPVRIVVFVHGSGNSNSSRRNQLVSEKLNNNNIGNLSI